MHLGRWCKKECAELWNWWTWALSLLQTVLSESQAVVGLSEPAMPTISWAVGPCVSTIFVAAARSAGALHVAACCWMIGAPSVHYCERQPEAIGGSHLSAGPNFPPRWSKTGVFLCFSWGLCDTVPPSPLWGGGCAVKISLDCARKPVIHRD